MELASAAGSPDAAYNLAHPWLRTTNWVLVAVGMSVCTGLLAMRIYTKVRIMRRFWWDDICLILAWAFSLATQFVILYAYTHAGFGVHIWNLTPVVFQRYQKCILSAGVIYVLALAMAKLALLMFYYRLLNMMPVWKHIIYLVAAIIVGYSIALTLALIFACQPLAKNWNVLIPGHCVNRVGLYLATAVTNTASDVILILIPIPLVSGLRLPLVQKLGMACMFGIGCLTIITSILRLATLEPLVSSPDQSYKLGLEVLFVVIEANFIIICGSLPYLRQFFRFHGPRWLGESRGSTSSASHRTGSSREPRPPYKRRKSGLSQLQDDIERALSRPEEAHCPGRGVRDPTGVRAGIS
ncbi:hypothetical protein BO70DRAFT_301531 [Aspergillus heteromorphus CBS 117.55]|uniref:Rhodopsin domain-containing protein n=1 Tax=Aspergillus heteromorphus CBS 117.55 TaxID=1448321 RepID=A0A317UYT4_9EURO|nr:uncharacterized protein BO70DRAFT_301531 [Aspergillus heteromorphus CBS 117.55]PWY66776.1 hypothetical protein BO70DRAFT_301531 [Aspergillus heteromorphus CBS 117.55]